ncbi:hypothetical protein D5S19_18895 [Amycolatopsis panacis]|uniref:Uncharacterized protein n=1 Tax=Amycolatopsis panacis TaxID=2340917 RepID=A0A419I261_9PSEU|nr:hypothetical protein D5S19_18895 [Amycolatopsis panacis]
MRKKLRISAVWARILVSVVRAAERTGEARMTSAETSRVSRCRTAPRSSEDPAHPEFGSLGRFP